MRCETFLCGDLVEPQAGESADVGLPGDLIVVGRGTVTKFDLERSDGGGAGGVGGLDVAGAAVVVAESGSGAVPVGAEFLGADVAPGADG